jgi:hypothetical protein
MHKVYNPKSEYEYIIRIPKHLPYNRHTKKKDLNFELNQLEKGSELENCVLKYFDKCNDVCYDSCPAYRPISKYNSPLFHAGGSDGLPSGFNTK